MVRETRFLSLSFLILSSFIFIINYGSVLAQEDTAQSTHFLLPPEIFDSYFPLGQNYMIPDDERTARLIERAKKAEQRGSTRQAAKYYFIAFQKAKETPAAPYIRFKQCFFEDRIDDSINCLLDIVTHYPEFPLIDGARFELAFRYFLQKKYDDALQVLEAIEESERSGSPIFTPYALAFSGIVSSKKGNHEQALGSYEQALDVLSRSSYAYRSEVFIKIYLEIAQSQISLNRYAEAEDLLRRIYGTATSTVLQSEALYHLARSYGMHAEDEIAYSAYFELTEKYPLSPFTMKAREALELMGDLNAVAVDALYDHTLLTGNYVYGRTELESPQPQEVLIGSGEYAVQLGAFSEERNAINFVSALKEKDFPAYFMKATVNEAEFFRVRVGPYITRQEAELIMQDLKDQGYTGFVVKEK